DLPTAHQFIAAERKIIDGVGYYGVLAIKNREAVVRIEIVRVFDVLWRCPRALQSIGDGTIIQRFGPGIARLKLQASAEPVGHTRLERVVIRLPNGSFIAEKEEVRAVADSRVALCGGARFRIRILNSENWILGRTGVNGRIEVIHEE